MEELRIEANGNLGPIDSSRIPRYAGAATYARLPRLDQVAKADVTVQARKKLKRGEERYRVCVLARVEGGSELRVEGAFRQQGSKGPR